MGHVVKIAMMVNRVMFGKGGSISPASPLISLKDCSSNMRPSMGGIYDVVSRAVGSILTAVLRDGTCCLCIIARLCLSACARSTKMA